jgi:hypothetical protein
MTNRTEYRTQTKLGVYKNLIYGRSDITNELRKNELTILSEPIAWQI